MFRLLPLDHPAPDFTLLDATGQSHTLSHYKDQSAVVLVFYPANFTPGCTKQLCRFRDVWDELLEKNIGVLGINPASPERHARFIQAHQLTFPLLSDPGLRVSKCYKATLIPGILQNRVVYTINQKGIISFAQVGDPPVQAILKSLGV